MATLLDDPLVTATLHALPGWEGDSQALVRVIQLPSDQDAELRRQVEVDSTAMGHAPKVEQLPDGTRFTLTTEEVGGVSELDVVLASHISDLAHRIDPSVRGVDAVRKGEVEIVADAKDDAIAIADDQEQKNRGSMRL